MTQTLVRNNGLGILEEPFYYLKCERIGMAKVGAQPSKIEESQIEKEGSRIYQKKSMQSWTNPRVSTRIATSCRFHVPRKNEIRCCKLDFKGMGFIIQVERVILKAMT